MMIFRLLVLTTFLPLWNSVSLAADSLKVYYKIDQKMLDAEKISKLDSFLLKNNERLKAITIIGYADFLGSNAYNLRLAQQRADNIKAYLQNKGLNVPIEASGRGEVYSTAQASPLGEPENRRVEIILTKFPQQIVSESQKILPKKKIPIPKNPVSADKREGSFDKITNLSQLDIGESISLPELTFQPGRHFLRQEAIPYVNTLLETLKKHPDMKIEIQGHICCNDGDNDGYDMDEKDYNLSVNRARYIYDYLIKMGVSPERMQYKGLGSSKPKIYPEITIEDEIANRRVEIVLIGK